VTAIKPREKKAVSTQPTASSQTPGGDQARSQNRKPKGLQAGRVAHYGLSMQHRGPVGEASHCINLGS
jgi:hypothetical protein